MKSIVALALALMMPAAMAATVATPAEDLLPEGLEIPEISDEEFNQMIVGGTPATAGEFPYIVSLSRSGSHFCGGALLNAYTVVTAAHCSTGVSASSVRVRAGSLQWASGGTQVAVRQILIHPSYSSSNINNDIALWRLSTPINAGGNIGYVSLPASGSDPAGGSSSTVAGWGYTSETGGGLPAALRRVDVPVVARSTCQSQYGASSITTAMFCAGVSGGGRDACQGDSGGPIVNPSRQLIGVVSWGNGCARPNYAGVYTRVGTFVSWINTNRWTS